MKRLERKEKVLKMKRIKRKGFFDYTWKSNPNAVYVGRPSKWGNPYKVKDYGLEECLRLYYLWLTEKLKEDRKFLEPLIGKDLVCFCDLDKPCHADILIEFVKAYYGDKE